MSLRLQLLAFGALTLVLPWTGLRFVQQMEGALRARLESELLAKAQIVANQDELQALSPASTAAAGVLPIYAAPLAAQPVLDGFRGDWSYHGENTDDSADLRALDLGPHRIWIGSYQTWLYLFFEIADDAVVYQSPDRQISGDRIVLLHANGSSQGSSALLIATPAPSDSLRAQSARIGDFVAEGGEVVGIAAAWRDRRSGPGGYSVEVRMPLARLNGSLGFGVIDVDPAPAGGYSVEFASRTWGLAPARDSDWPRPGPLIEADGFERVLSAYAGDGDRYRVFDDAGRLLADTGPIEPTPEVDPRNMPLLERFFRLLLRRDDPAFEEGSAPGRMALPVVRESLAGMPATAWYRHGPEVGAIVAAAVGVDDEAGPGDTAPAAARPIGAVLLEQASDPVLTTSNAAMMRLMSTTLLVGMVTALALLAYASFLSLRIGRLARSAEAALGPRGEINVTLPGTRARDEIGDLSRSFEDLLRRLREYTEYLKSLKSKLSHELRTPLAIVSTSVDNLEHEPGTESGKAYLDRLRHGTQRLESILQAMTAATRVEQAIVQTETERFDLAAVVASCASSYEDVYPAATFIANLPPHPLPIDGAPELIEQLLDKLVDNAVGFAAPGTPIGITLAAADGEAVLSVSNRGPLLPEAMRHQLFDSLVSVREIESDRPHLGLGLYIVSLIADFHDARVTAENLPDSSGVVFSLFVPLADAD